ncbi:hypothetical protein AWB68_06552 [Caballeronia choica]|jgi:hypothetical protein|uniref:Uncharacterized protein n=1 Tax=Caballeronia choica TaxID=326476 RepID=A0A158KQ14_9BURK|nr:hypothetical protein AWB68_06552 [Caballeronia choica]
MHRFLLISLVGGCVKNTVALLVDRKNLEGDVSDEWTYSDVRVS